MIITRRINMKSIVKVSNEYVIKTVKRHEIRMKKANKIYVAKTDKQLNNYLIEKGII